MPKLRTCAAALVMATALVATGATGAAGASGPRRPAVVRLTLSHRVLGVNGGASTVRLEARNGATCWFTAPRVVRISRAKRACRSGHAVAVAHLGPTDLTRVRAVSIVAWVRAENGATARRRVVLRQRALARLRVSLSSITPVTVGVPFRTSLVVRGGRAPYHFAVTSGSLPPGITLSASGVVQGTPTTAGEYAAAVSITDASRPHHLRTATDLRLPVRVPTMSVTTTSLPPATVGQVYDTVLAASGGSAPYHFAVTGGILPAGLSLQANGLLFGTPTVGGSFPLTITATDASSPAKTASAQLTLVVNSGSLQVTSTTAPVATQGVPFLLDLTAAGGTAPYTWTLTGGVLPSGMALSSTGILSGTATATGTYPVAITLTDASQPVQSRQVDLTITVVASASFTVTTPSTLPAATVGAIYGATFSASGGTSPYTWEQLSGTLPPGLAFYANGTLSGTPATAGTYSFTVQVHDSGIPVQTAQETVSITVQS